MDPNFIWLLANKLCNTIGNHNRMVGVGDRYQKFTTAALPRRAHSSVHSIIPSEWLLNFRRQQNLDYCTGLSL